MNERRGPVGLEALNLMGLRLGEVVGELKGAAAKIAEAASRPDIQTSVDVRVRTLEEAFGPAAPPRRPAPATAPATPADPTTREPLVDVFDEADAWVLTAELPGVADADVAITLEEGAVSIETTGARRYRTRQPMPTGLDLDGLSRRLANGILEVRIRKRPEAQP